MSRIKNKYIIYFIGLLVIVSLSVGFSALQKQLFVSDIKMNVRLHQDVRVSNINLSKASGNAVANFEDFNKEKLYGSVTFPSTSSYVLYKVDLTNYGNVKSGLLNINNNESGIKYQICDSNGSNCTDETETPVCNGSNCTLGSTKEIYVKISSTSSGTKNVDLDFDFEPYNNVTYTYFNESTSSFKKEIMSNDTYTVTLTSKPEEIELSGSAVINYNKNTGVLTLSNIESDIELHAKYLVNTVAETAYSGVNPNNYVRFNNTLYRIITKENIDDGYGNEELRTKLVSNSSIGNNAFDDDSNDFSESTLKDVLNTTYYNGLSSEAKDLIDTAAWTSDYAGYIGLIDSGDYTDNSSWLNKQQYTLTSSENNKVKAVGASGLVDSDVTVSRATYPVAYLKNAVLIVGGSGTSSDPYILELQTGGVQSNPTIIAGKTLTVTGSNQELVTVSNKVGTPYYSKSTQLNESNYSSSGSTSIPSEKSVGTYTIYYYIPSGEGYKAKSGRVTSKINAKTYIVTYTKGSNISAIGKTNDSCTTSGYSLTCSVTLPSITPSEGYESGRWSDGSNYYNPGSSYTLSATGKTLTASVSGKTYTATFVKNGASSIGSTSLSCTVTSGSTCTVTAPSITRSGFTIDGWNTSSSATTGVTGLLTLSGNVTYNAITHKDVTSTFYYNTNTTSGSLSASTKTSSCTIRNTQTSCTAIVPSEVSSSIGKYNSPYKGVASARSTMEEANLTVTANTTFYTIYSKEVTIYRPTSETEVSSIKVYRNEFFTSTTAMSSVISKANNSTTAMTSISGLWSSATFSGYSTSVNTATVTSGLTSIANSISKKDGATYYLIGTYVKSVEVTFYYSKAANGTVGSVTASANQTRNIYCASTSTTATSVKTEGSISTPTLTGEVAPLGTTSISGFATSNTSMSTSTSYNTATTKYYKVYRNTVTVYKPSSTSSCNSTNTVFYRNAFINIVTPTVDTTKYTTILATTNTGTSDNASYSPNVSGYDLYGFSSESNTIIKTYTTLAELKASSLTSAYGILLKEITATSTFYYSKNTDGTIGSVTSSATEQSYLKCTTNTSAQVILDHVSISVPTITDEVSPLGTTVLNGFATSNANMTPTTTYTSANTKYYRVYSNPVTIYRPTSKTEVSGITVYRNSYVNNSSPTVDSDKYNTVIAATNTGTSNINSIDGLWTEARFRNYSLTPGNTDPISNTYGSVTTGITKHTSTTFYLFALYSESLTMTFYYSKDTTGTVGSYVTNVDQTRYLYCSSNITASSSLASEGSISAPTLPDEVAPIGTSAKKGFASSDNNMNAVSKSKYSTETLNYYRVYQTRLNIRKPSCVIDYVFRNAYIDVSNPVINTTKYKVVIASDYEEISDITGYSLTNNANFAGYAVSSSASSVEYGLTSIADSIKARSEDTYYIFATYYQDISVEFYYSIDSDGTIGTATSTGSQLKSTICNIINNSSRTTTNLVSEGTVNAPVLSDEVVPTGTSLVNGYSDEASDMNPTNGPYSTANLYYYRVYRNNVTIYRPTSETAASSITTYRNAFIYDHNSVNVGQQYRFVISSTPTGTSSMSSIDGLWNEAVFCGYSLTANTDVIDNNLRNIDSIKNRSETTYYVIGKIVENITFVYNSNTSCGGLTLSTVVYSTGTYGSGGKSYCTSNSTSTYYHGTVTGVPNEIVNSKGQYNSTFKAMANINSLTPVTTFVGGNTYYAVYSQSVTNYYYGTSYTSRTLYRNEYLASASATTYTTILATADNSKTNYSTAVGPGNSSWVGLSTGQDTTVEYSSVAAAATSSTCATTLYTVYQFNVTYEMGSNVSAIGATSGICKVTTSNTSCNVTLPSITANNGYTSVGWHQNNGATTGTAAQTTYAVSSNNQTLYANAQDTTPPEITSVSFVYEAFKYSDDPNTTTGPFDKNLYSSDSKYSLNGGSYTTPATTVSSYKTLTPQSGYVLQPVKDYDANPDSTSPVFKVNEYNNATVPGIHLGKISYYHKYALGGSYIKIVGVTASDSGEGVNNTTVNANINKQVNISQDNEDTAYIDITVSDNAGNESTYKLNIHHFYWGSEGKYNPNDGTFSKYNGWNKMDWVWIRTPYVLSLITKYHNNWYYFDDGHIRLGKQIIDGKEYYFADEENTISLHSDVSVAVPAGALAYKYWVIDEDTEDRYYYDECNDNDPTSCSTLVTNSWLNWEYNTNPVGAGRYYFLSDGKMAKNWKKLNNNWYYFGTDGVMRTGWQTISSKKYYLGSDGIMQTGWKKIDNYWYYFYPEGTSGQTTGAMATGWIEVSGNKFYLNTDGQMQTGWKKIDNKWFYFYPEGTSGQTSGAMATGWIKVSNYWYYLYPSGTSGQTEGSMATGWLELSGIWYYLFPEGNSYNKPTGSMAVSATYTINGTSYTFDSNGHCTNP